MLFILPLVHIFSRGQKFAFYRGDLTLLIVIIITLREENFAKFKEK